MSTPLKKNRISKPSQSSQKPRNIKFISTDTSKLQAVSIAKATSTHRKRGRPKGSKNGSTSIPLKNKQIPSPSKYDIDSQSSDPSLAYINNKINIQNQVSNLDINSSALLQGLDPLDFGLCPNDFSIKQEPITSPDISFLTPVASSPDFNPSQNHPSKPAYNCIPTFKSISSTSGFLMSPTSATSPKSKLSINISTSNSSKPQSKQNTRKIPPKPIDPTTGKPKTAKRRPHSKSRHGCTTCKRRRVKCDETHPICNNCKHLNLECSFAGESIFPFVQGGLNIMDIRFFYHYTTVVCKSIMASGISNDSIWQKTVPEMAFEHPFLMHAILAFSANHFSRTHRADFESDPAAIEQVVDFHRGDALKLLGEAGRNVTPKSYDALVAAAILVILDSIANASISNQSPSPASSWFSYIRGASTILMAIGPPAESSCFFANSNFDLSDLLLGLVSSGSTDLSTFSSLECFDDDLTELYPVSSASPYFNSLSYLDKLFRQRYKSDFVLRLFSFPALLDHTLVQMLLNGDPSAKRIIQVYYKFVRSFTFEMREPIWFLEDIEKLLPAGIEQEFSNFGFITQALSLNIPNIDELTSTLFGSDIQQHLFKKIELYKGQSLNDSRKSVCSVQSDQLTSNISSSDSLSIASDNSILSDFDIDSLYPSSDLTSFNSEFMNRAVSGSSIGSDDTLTVSSTPSNSSISAAMFDKLNKQDRFDLAESIASKTGAHLSSLLGRKVSSAELISIVNRITSSPSSSAINISSENSSAIRHSSTPSIDFNADHNPSLRSNYRHTSVGGILGNNTITINSPELTTNHLHIDKIKFSSDDLRHQSIHNHIASVSHSNNDSSRCDSRNDLSLDSFAWKTDLPSLDDPISAHTINNNDSLNCYSPSPSSLCSTHPDTDTINLGSCHINNFSTIQPSLLDHSPCL